MMISVKNKTHRQNNERQNLQNSLNEQEFYISELKEDHEKREYALNKEIQDLKNCISELTIKIENKSQHSQRGGNNISPEIEMKNKQLYEAYSAMSSLEKENQGFKNQILALRSQLD